MALLLWKNTDRALQELKQLLTCKLCGQLEKTLYSFEKCDHYFCRKCAENAVNVHSKCPTCGSFAWVSDLKVNRQLGNTVLFCTELEKLISTTEKGDTHKHRACDTKEDNSSDSCDKVTNEVLKDHHADGLTSQMQEFNDNVEEAINDTESQVGVPYGDESLNVNPHGNQCTTNIESSCSSWFPKPLNGPAKTYSKKTKSKPRKHLLTAQIDKNNINKQEQTTSIYDFDYHPSTSKEDSDVSEGSISPKNEKRERKVPSKRAANKATDVQQSSSKRTNLRQSSRTKQWNDNAKVTNGDQPGSIEKAKLSTDNRNQVKTKQTKNLEKKNKRGETPLHVACIKGDSEVVQNLLKDGANPNTKDFAGWTPLHEASNHGFVKVVELLLDYGAIVNMPGCEHDTALHDAVANNRAEIASILVRRGASTIARNKNGLLPIDYARTTEMKNILTPLEGLTEIATSNAKCDQVQCNRVSTPEKKVLLSTGLNVQEKAELKRCANSLHADVVEEFSTEVTHLVAGITEKNLCSRTIKYIMAVLTGKWIISPEWIKRSLKAKKWLNEEEYEVLGTEDAKNEAPKRARINSGNQFPRLFDGCSFFLWGTFGSPKKDDVVDMIKKGGGKILNREPKVTEDLLILAPSSAETKLLGTSLQQQSVVFHAKPSSGLSVCTQYILYDENSKRLPKVVQSPVLATVPVAWMLECISNFELIQVRDSYT